MKKYLVSLFFAGMVIGALPFEAHALFKSAKVTLIVVDENGQPIEGADAGIGFEKNTGWGTDATAQRGLTDARGRFTATGSCNGHIGYGVRKEGYYRSHYDYDFKGVGAFGWEPWNPELKIVMRKIENQVPMYIRDSKRFKKGVAVPSIKKNIGFDLVAYDWVAPYGKGQHSDFIFYLEKKYTNMSEYSGRLVVTFSNANDGLIKVNEEKSEGSTYKLPRFAPESGYENELTIETRQDLDQVWVKGFNLNDNYIFRVRSEVEEGMIVKAIYGKIIGPILLEPREDPAEIYFKYYLNPDGTRNLEHDPQRNLFYEN